MGIIPSYGTGRLCEIGLPAAPEADLTTLTAMLILQDLTGQSTFLENYVIDFDREAMILSHDGHGNPALAAKPADVAVKHSIYYQGVNGFGAGFEFAYAPGPVTNLALVSVGGRWRLNIAEGESHRHPAAPGRSAADALQAQEAGHQRLVQCLADGRLAAPHGAGVRSPGGQAAPPGEHGGLGLLRGVIWLVWAG